jgi:hypothetical protein
MKRVMISEKEAAEMVESNKNEPGEVIWSMFRCADLNCNTLLTKFDHSQGRCGGCQGIRFVVARYLTDEESENIKSGILIPHKVDLNVVGVEPSSVRPVQ